MGETRRQHRQLHPRPDRAPGGDAIALLYVDAPVPDAVLDELRKSELFQMVAPLEFEV